MRHWQTCFLKSEGQLKTMLFGISQLINQFHTPPPCIFEKILQIILLFIGLWSADNETVKWNFSTAWWRNFKKIPRIIEAEKFVKFPLHSKILRLEIDFFDTCRKKKMAEETYIYRRVRIDHQSSKQRKIRTDFTNSSVILTICFAFNWRSVSSTISRPRLS